jgi:ATP-dependent DNA ligase
LLVGVYKDKEFIFVAKVKDGFVPRIRDEIFPALKTLQTAQCPSKNLPEKRASGGEKSLTAEKMKQSRWVKPKLVCQVEFVHGPMPGTSGIAPSLPWDFWWVCQGCDKLTQKTSFS